MDARNELQESVDAGWRSFRDAVEALPADAFEQQTASGWTIKEMIAHVAFWEETLPPFLDGMFRGRAWPATEDWYGGGSVDFSDGWPSADVHNAREAAWARGRPVAEVLERLDRAHARAEEAVAGLTAEEQADQRFVDQIAAETYGHYPEHLAELRTATSQ